MKKISKYLILILLVLVSFILIPIKAKAQESVWTQDLNLSTSTASAITQVEDGMVVLQYGQDLENNLLIKYDFDGNKIWDIPNTYGYNIESVSDGFIVWQETKITKFDKDKNIIWSKDIEFHTSWYDYGGLGNKLTEVSGGYIICSAPYNNGYSRSIIYIDNEGNIKRRTAQKELLKSIGTGYVSELRTITQSLDEKNIIIVSHEYYTGVDNILINIFDQDLNFKKAYVSSMIGKDNVSSSDIHDIVETDNTYIMYGKQILIFDKSGILINTLDKISLDMQFIGEYVFSYTIEPPKEGSNIYKVSLIKYDKDMEEISKIDLPLTFKSVKTFYGSQLVHFNKFTYTNNNDQLNIAILNAPLTFVHTAHSDAINIDIPSDDYLNSKYQLINYRFKMDEEDKKENNGGTDSSDDKKENTNLGIINNIIKNPQTNSIIIITVFVVLIFTISITSYFIYKHKIKSKVHNH